MSTNEQKLASIIFEIGHIFKKNSTDDSCCNHEYAKYFRVIEALKQKVSTMSELAEKLELTAGTVTAIIDEMINLKLVIRFRDENIDRRVVFIKLDELGLKQFELIEKLHIKIAKNMLSCLEEEEKEKFMEYMIKIQKNIKK